MFDYEIRINGNLDKRWQQWFGEAHIFSERMGDGPLLTTIHCPADQVKLRGMLNKIWDLNLELISLRRISDSADMN